MPVLLGQTPLPRPGPPLSVEAVTAVLRAVYDEAYHVPLANVARRWLPWTPGLVERSWSTLRRGIPRLSSFLGSDSEIPRPQFTDRGCYGMVPAGWIHSIV